MFITGNNRNHYRSQKKVTSHFNEHIDLQKIDETQTLEKQKAED
jgi:hypothetical protein